MNRILSFTQSVWTLMAAFLLALPLSSTAETLMMPDRDALKGEDVVVWGVTTLTGVNYTLACGDGTVATAAVADGSYIAMVCNYVAGGTFTATLSVDGGAETAAADVAVFDAALLSADDQRSVRVNLAIEDGLRWLWTMQTGRAAGFPASTTTFWDNGQFDASATSIIVLAFENHGYRLTNDNVAPTGVYEKYIVRRGLNFVISKLVTRALGVEAAGNPCVGVPVDGDECTGLRNSDDNFHESYTTGLAGLALAGSGALLRNNTEVVGYTNGKTYGEILQRVANALVWGQINTSTTGDRGGWYYNFNSSSSDGSTVGWALLALLDAEAAGATVPAYAKTEFEFALTGGLNNNGSFDYQADGNPASLNSVGIEKGGIPLQGMFWTGEIGGARVDSVKTYISDRWSSGRIGGDTNWGCLVGGQYNMGCAYSMFNSFKGLKLQGIVTLPGVGRPAGPGAQPADDWHADQVDWLVANQTAPTTTAGGGWGTMQFSCCGSSAAMEVAIAELILSPVVLVLPDPVKFASVGLSPPTATNPVGTDHTVTAHAEGFCTPEPCTGANVPGATVDFEVLTGPNTGETGQDVTDVDGNATFTYTDTAGPGTDTIQASIGGLKSNIVEKIWQAEGACVESIKARPKPGKVSVYWTPVDGAASYDVARSETDANSGFGTIATDHMTDYATYLDTGVTNTVTYWYQVTPKTAAGDELCTSDSVEATPPEASSRGAR